MEIPIIDIFAGPGGLGEGFCNLTKGGRRIFKIALSIEKDNYAHKTLTLRSFFRQFNIGEVPEDYYKFLRQEISLEDLFDKWPQEYMNACNEAWQATLGANGNSVSNDLVDEKIELAIGSKKNWLLIGGPPCQAYSVAGRNRRKVIYLDESKDERVSLYKQYLRILAVHNPPVFVMENVKGLLSAATKESHVFTMILKDLADPVNAYLSGSNSNGKPLTCPGYKIYSLVVEPVFDDKGNPIFQQKDYVICTENYGIPQTRHRIILLGIRNDIACVPRTLKKSEEIGITKVLSDLPKLRGGLSKIPDSFEAWYKTINKVNDSLTLSEVDKEIIKEIKKQLSSIKKPENGTGKEYLRSITQSEYMPDWFRDSKLEGICNHTSRGHMESDLIRYYYMSCFARVKGYSPQLKDLPVSLLPEHKNVYNNDGSVTGKFPDRFKVQLKNKPSKTITSHISQDGHYFIHYDPTQCRSITVREAARIQTFPDNYFFCGPRTSQFIQVGNAVPPLLAFKIAEIVNDIFIKFDTASGNHITEINRVLCK